MFRKSACSPSDISTLDFDLFISAYNDSDRVNIVWEEVHCRQRIWIVHEEYGFDQAKLPPSDAVFACSVGDGELPFWSHVLADDVFSALPPGSRIGIDITGLMRPHVIALPLALALAGIPHAFALYSDPSAYVRGTKTRFSIGPVTRVSPINGFEGVHITSTSPDDLVIVGAGYDDELISAVAESKRSAEQVIMVGLPSLQPHMYQESISRIYRARESITSYGTRTNLYAPAYDPFVTAAVLSEYVNDRRKARSELNVYLSAVGPKTQVLGFSLFYLYEQLGEATSVIFPYAESYAPETSTGIGRTRVYELELSIFDLTSFGTV